MCRPWPQVTVSVIVAYPHHFVCGLLQPTAHYRGLRVVVMKTTGVMLRLLRPTGVMQMLRNVAWLSEMDTRVVPSINPSVSVSTTPPVPASVGIINISDC